MKRIERHKKVVDKKAIMPSGSMVRVETYYNTWSGYLNCLDSGDGIRGIEQPTYMLVSDNGAFYSVEEDKVNGNKQTQTKYDGQLVLVHARLKLSAKDWDWYPCKWKSGRLVYAYKETDFVDEEHELVVGEILDIYAASDSTSSYAHDATVVVSRPTQIAVETYGKLVVFTVGSDTDELVSDCGDYRIDGRYAASQYDEELHS
ncbi:hypothetical protein AVU32_gp084 [Vibrio phage ValKK3]|uniref:Uncharacterized protein n=2 Tax=Schizotequatrovirus TaxID=1198137 RepID=V9LYS4_9CAUD|nr:hypothetical protein CF80_gp062 [Vibrio phage VH7D]YP_009201187.1 hypothetical protein AVU32_gp084 [Vibrio phage ValKK3]AGB06849.1 hypothetical protein [Vibrio phage VH7D]AJT60925.1 hypothetical protein [Vibrio phage ValKK3]